MAGETAAGGWTIEEVVGRLPNASNATLLARTTDGVLLVYKPAAGENPLSDFDFGTLATREALTYEIAVALGFDVVPETVLLDGPFGAGSAQRFVDEDPDFDPSPLINSADDSLWPVVVLDLVINNADRKAGHVIADRSGEMWAIDHGISLHAEDKLRTVLWNFRGARLPNDMVDALGSLCDAMNHGLSERISALLSSREADAFRSRVERLVADPVHPQPPLDRPAVPWPIW